MAIIGVDENGPHWPQKSGDWDTADAPRTFFFWDEVTKDRASASLALRRLQLAVYFKLVTCCRKFFGRGTDSKHSLSIHIFKFVGPTPSGEYPRFCWADAEGHKPRFCRADATRQVNSIDFEKSDDYNIQ